jgi:hypothetical protein
MGSAVTESTQSRIPKPPAAAQECTWNSCCASPFSGGLNANTDPAKAYITHHLLEFGDGRGDGSDRLGLQLGFPRL